MIISPVLNLVRLSCLYPHCLAQSQDFDVVFQFYRACRIFSRLFFSILLNLFWNIRTHSLLIYGSRVPCGFPSGSPSRKDIPPSSVSSDLAMRYHASMRSGSLTMGTLCLSFDCQCFCNPFCFILMGDWPSAKPLHCRKCFFCQVMLP